MVKIKYGGLIGAGLGFWLFGGPIGAILGFAIGSYIQGRSGSKSISTHGSDFTMSLLILSAAVIKADGRIEKTELDFVRDFFNKQFGTTHTSERMRVLEGILKQEFSLRPVCIQIKDHTSHPTRIQMIQYLFGISYADGHVHPKEIEIIASIASYFDIGTADFDSIKAMYIKESDGYYKILEIDKSATDDEFKRAYRRMAAKFHPDKVTHLGDEFRKAAKERIQKVNEAYEEIKKERGLK